MNFEMETYKTVLYSQNLNPSMIISFVTVSISFFSIADCCGEDFQGNSRFASTENVATGGTNYFNRT